MSRIESSRSCRCAFRNSCRCCASSNSSSACGFTGPSASILRRTSCIARSSSASAASSGTVSIPAGQLGQRAFQFLAAGLVQVLAVGFDARQLHLNPGASPGPLRLGAQLLQFFVGSPPAACAVRFLLRQSLRLLVPAPNRGLQTPRAAPSSSLIVRRAAASAQQPSARFSRADCSSRFAKSRVCVSRRARFACIDRCRSSRPPVRAQAGMLFRQPAPVRLQPVQFFARRSSACSCSARVCSACSSAARSRATLSSSTHAVRASRSSSNAH